MTIVSERDADVAEAALARRTGSPWYVETFLAVGGWIAGLLAAGAIFAFVAAIFTRAPAAEAPAALALALGLGFVFFGTRFGRGSDGDFRRHFSISMIAAGLTAATAGGGYLIWSVLDNGGGAASGAQAARLVGLSGLAASLLLAAAGAWSTRAMKDAILTFLTTSAWFWLVAFSLAMLGGERFGESVWFRNFPAAAALAGVILLTRPVGREVFAAVGAALLIAPMIFLASVANGVGAIGLESPAESYFNGVVVLAGAVYCLALIRDRYRLTSLLAATALIAAAIWFLPDSGGVALLILLAGLAASHRGLAAVGVVAIAWFIGKFYYDLRMTLLEKSAILAGLGAATLLGATLLRRLSRTAPARAGEIAAPGRRPILATLAFGFLLLASLVLVNHGVFKLERDFAGAREILLPLGPVDPRSLIQGDYMTLVFRETIYPSADEQESLPDAGEVFLKIDADEIASFSRVARPGEDPAPDEVRVDYARLAGEIRYCPTSYFFQEGEAEIFSAARFAVLAVAADGKSRLVALADAERRVIDPGAAAR